MIAAVDVLVQPSLIDSFGRTIGEAMFLGTPVVATDAGGIREAVEPGGDGLLFPSGDHEALAGALLALARDPGLRDRLAEAGRRKAANLFDLPLQTQRIEAVMTAALALGPGPYALPRAPLQPPAPASAGRHGAWGL